MDEAPDLLVLTWNLDENIEAAKLALEYLADRAAAGLSCVAAFQEPPRAIDGLIPGSLKAHAQATPTAGKKAPHNVVVTSSDVVPDPDGPRLAGHEKHDTERRMEGQTFASAHWSGLRFLAAHGWDRLTHPTADERGDWAKIVRRVLDYFWTGGPLIVAGDLNANPWHREVTYRGGWFAARPADLRKRESYKLAGLGDRATQLVNPMWKTIASARAPGSHFYDHDDVLWHCLDQILLSQGLYVPGLAPVVKDVLMNKTLVDGEGAPARVKGIPLYSDHLPVELILPGAIVKAACRATSNLEGSGGVHV